MNKSGYSARTRKLIFQEASSQCAFCDEADVSALEIHHIIALENAGGDGPENLILTCSSRHSKITHGVISPADVVLKKRELIYGEPRHARKGRVTNFIQVAGGVSHSVLGNVVHISGKRLPRMNYPVGSVGANIHMKNYIDYLIKKYYDYRKADESFGAYEHGTKFHHAEIHTSIQRKFRAKTFFVPESLFQAECEYIRGRIDQTILGKRNKNKGIQNYRSFEEFLERQGKAPNK